MHSDKCDRVVQHGRWLAMLGSQLYDLMLHLNHRFNRLRRGLGLRYWSLAADLNHRVKNAVNYIGDFEHAVAAAAMAKAAERAWPPRARRRGSSTTVQQRTVSATASIAR